MLTAMCGTTAINMENKATMSTTTSINTRILVLSKMAKELRALPQGRWFTQVMPRGSDSHAGQSVQAVNAASLQLPTDRPLNN